MTTNDTIIIIDVTSYSPSSTILLPSLTEIEIITRNENIKWSTYASAIYFLLYVLLVLILSLYMHKTKQFDTNKKFIQAVWARRSIYGQVLTHFYDTATDIGVLIEWAILATDNVCIFEIYSKIMLFALTIKVDYESIDMVIMVFSSIGFLLFYRVILVFIAIRSDDEVGGNDCTPEDFYLSILDIYIIKTVYLSLKHDVEEPTPQQKIIQLLESIFESLPQVCLRVIFFFYMNHCGMRCRCQDKLHKLLYILRRLYCSRFF